MADENKIMMLGQRDQIFLGTGKFMKRFGAKPVLYSYTGFVGKEASLANYRLPQNLNFI